MAKRSGLIGGRRSEHAEAKRERALAIKCGETKWHCACVIGTFFQISAEAKLKHFAGGGGRPGVASASAISANQRHPLIWRS